MAYLLIVENKKIGMHAKNLDELIVALHERIMYLARLNDPRIESDFSKANDGYFVFKTTDKELAGALAFQPQTEEDAYLLKCFEEGNNPS